MATVCSRAGILEGWKILIPERGRIVPQAKSLTNRMDPHCLVQRADNSAIGRNTGVVRLRVRATRVVPSWTADPPNP